MSRRAQRRHAGIPMLAAMAPLALGACASEPAPSPESGASATPQSQPAPVAPAPKTPATPAAPIARASGVRFPLAPGGYARAFDAARDTLREAGFSLDRVDAHEGVITTRPRVSSGLATPWTGAEGSLGASASALFNVERRRVEVRFVRIAGSAPGEFVEGEVSARVLRTWSPNRRVDSSSIRLTSYAGDPALAAKGFEPDYTRDVGTDEGLAERLADAIREKSLLPEPPPPEGR